MPIIRVSAEKTSSGGISDTYIFFREAGRMGGGEGGGALPKNHIWLVPATGTKSIKPP